MLEVLSVFIITEEFLQIFVVSSLVYLTTFCSSIGYIASFETVTTNDKLRRIWKVVVIVFLKVL